MFTTVVLIDVIECNKYCMQSGVTLTYWLGFFCEMTIFIVTNDCRHIFYDVPPGFNDILF